MDAASQLRKDIRKVSIYALLALFLLPGLTLLFAAHAVNHYNDVARHEITRQIVADETLTAGQREQAKAFFVQHPLSGACFGADPALSEYAKACEPYSHFWQFAVAQRISAWTLLAGLATLLSIGVLGWLAFRGRAAQYSSLVAGWRLLTLVMAAEVIVQGGMLVWMSFWVTAYFFEIYILKLILLAALLVGVAVLGVVGSIFKRPPEGNVVHGELIDDTASPRLWQRIRELAQTMQTAPPDQIVAGIDDNFFVTEAPLTVGERRLGGRSLFVSLPLLRVLERSEADAVLAHELAHLQGGDTSGSARLGPKLNQYDLYCQQMREGGLTVAVYHVMLLYRFILEFAMKRDSREREFRADRAAAALVSPRAIVQSLVKITAYSSYRAEVERKLFEQRERHGETIGISGSIAGGLAPYATSAQFLATMKSANVPHPFDSHPALPERMANVDCQLPEPEYGPLVAGAPADTWVADIGAADEMEQRLWQAYERNFSAAHEQKLAYFYEPANEAEQAVVLKYFPPVAFPLKKDAQVVVSYQGLQLPGHGELVGWDSVKDLKYEEGFGGDKLEVVRPERGVLGAKTIKVTLYGIKPHREAFKQALGRYWQRHQVMRKAMAEAVSAH